MQNLVESFIADAIPNWRLRINNGILVFGACENAFTLYYVCLSKLHENYVPLCEKLSDSTDQLINAIKLFF